MLIDGANEKRASLVLPCELLLKAIEGDRQDRKTLSGKNKSPEPLPSCSSGRGNMALRYTVKNVFTCKAGIVVSALRVMSGAIGSGNLSSIRWRRHIKDSL